MAYHILSAQIALTPPSIALSLPSIALAPPSIVLTPPSIALATHLFLSFVEMFQWRKSLVCRFGRQLCRFGDYTRAAVFCACATIYRTGAKICKVIQLNRVSIIFKQMAAVNFLQFYFVKWFVKMDIKVTSNIKFKNLIL